jgi:hypothetical protein
MRDAESAAAKSRSSVRIIISDPATAKLVRRAVTIFVTMMRARAN